MDINLGISSLTQHTGDTCIMPLSYLPPVRFYQIMLKYKHVILDVHEHFHKQFYFNRCEIYGANGKLKLSIPIVKNHERTPLKDVAISYEQNWKTIHWRSLQAAYRRSPFFEFYEDDFRTIYEGNRIEKLIDWNILLFNLVSKLLGVEINYSFTEFYQKEHEGIVDYRSINTPKSKAITDLYKIEYQQVFQEKYGFIENLSIIDLLFCEGHYARQLLFA